MTTLLLYFLAAFGFAYVAGHSVISLAFREWLADLGAVAPIVRAVLALIECPACLGWWVGLATGLAVWRTDAWLWNGPAWLAIPLLPFATAGCNFLLGRLTGLMPVPPLD